MKRNISGVILAGGTNKRFNGILKAKIVIGRETIISRMIGILKDIFDEIIIVTNTPDEFREYENCKITGDLILNKGPLGGIHAALNTSSKEALFVVAGDMPLIGKDLIVRQIEHYEKDPCEILIPRVNNYIEPLHGIYSKSIISRLEEYLSGENNYAIRDFFKETVVCCMDIAASELTAGNFTNINTPADVEVVKKLLDTR
jgi:molybdenum cofactor guanylyltransferase